MTWTEERIPIGAVPEAVERGLARLEVHGLRRGGGDWFSAYTRRLREVAKGSFPMTMPEDPLFLEASSQCVLLLTALELEQHVEPSFLVKRLRNALGGRPLPPEERGAHDPPRNFLFELGVGALLRRKGFSLRVVGDEDWTAIADELPPFVVECTRPTHAGTLSQGLKHVHKQLVRMGRADGTQTLGLPVIGLDGVFGLRSAHLFQNAQALNEAVIDALDRGIRRVRRLERHLAPPYLPFVHVAAVALFTSVFLKDEGAPYGVSQLGLYPIDEDDPRVQETVAKLSRTIGHAARRRPPVRLVVPPWPPMGRFLTYEPPRRSW